MSILMRREMWYGLNVEGKEFSIYVETLDDHDEFQIAYPKLEDPNQTRYMGEDENIPGYGKTVAQSKKYKSDIYRSGRRKDSIRYTFH